MATVQDLVTAAHKEIGVAAQSEALTSAESADGFVRLNRFLDRQAADNLVAYTETRTTWTITANDGEYTVGSGGNVNIARPVFIRAVAINDTSTTPDTEIPLHRLTEDEYVAVIQKAATNTYPQAWYYDRAYTSARANIKFYPVPTSTTLEGVIYHSTAVVQFAALTTTVSLPPGYEEMYVTNLAVLLCPSFERQPHPALLLAARESLAAVRRANRRLNEIRFEAGALAGRGYYYNPHTDTP